ncbi:hypothetical protein I4U23_019506 [Adineta vaga]|nr:hypothetical protein I4U23_019506 [Adineta vaga]
MYNKNWSLNQNTSTSNVDWSALADSWMQQREQQVHWQQAPPPLPPPPPPPQFLLNAPPIPPPGPPPIGMSFPPLPPSQLGILPHHHQHQLQVGSNTTQESFTMTNIENVHWRPTPPPAFVMPNAPLQWRPNTNQSQPIFPIQTEMAPSFGGRNFWPPGNSVQQAPPPPVPPPPLPPAPLHSSPMPPPFPTSSFQHPPVDKRMMNSSFNTSIPSLMDLPTSYASSPVPPPVPVPPVSMLSNESTSRTMPDIPNKSNKNDKRRKIPAWLRDALGQMEKEKERKLQNTSNLNNNSNLSINDTSSKFDDDDDDDHDEEEDDTNEKITRLDKELSAVFNDDDDEEDQDEDNEDEDSSSALISSTPIVTRRSRFVGYCDWTFEKIEQCVYYHLIFF